MTNIALKQMFINDVYDNNRKDYHRAKRKDYFKVQLEWSIYIDNLCKDGIITQEQYENAVFR